MGRRDVLQALRAEILEIILDLVGDLVVDDPRDIDAARLGQRLEPRRDIDAVAEHVAALDDDVAEIDPDPHGDALLVGQRLVCFTIASRSAAAQRVASTTLSNSLSAISPACLKMFPSYSPISGWTISVRTPRSWAIPASSPGNSRR